MDQSRPTGAAVRAACRAGQHTGPTAGYAPGYVQANLVILPREYAYDFMLFCQRNPKPCPLLDVTNVGDPVPQGIARSADLRTDLPAYRVWKHGELTDEPHDISHLWHNTLVSFLIGCSFTFENALIAAGVPVRHIEQNVNVPMYRTNRECRAAGCFKGPLVVSMRPMKAELAVKATHISGRFPRVHGTPIHFGNPHEIGIEQLNQPDFGDAVELRDGEIPVFWACGVTPQAALMQARIPFAVTHKPGHMFVSDWKDSDLESD